MTTATDMPRAGAPWHFWVIVVIALLWNGFGGYDYTMSQMRGDAYFREMGMTDPQIAYMHSYPVWMTAVWAVGVWGSVLGSILLLIRSRYALHAFVVSLAGLLVSLAYTHLMSDGGQVMGQQGMIMNAVITAGCLFFVWYSWMMTKRGLLR